MKYAVLVLAFVVAAVGARFAISTFYRGGVDLPALVEEVNKDTPMTIDADIRLERVSNTENTLTYHYTLTNRAGDDVDKTAFREDVGAELQKRACSSSDTRRILNEDITIEYAYQGRDGVHVDKLQVTPADCLAFDTADSSEPPATPAH